MADLRESECDRDIRPDSLSHDLSGIRRQARRDIHRDDLPAERLQLEAGHRSIASLGRTYCEAEGLTALIGSSGYLEIALRNGSAARLLGLSVGDRVRLARDR